MKQIIKNFNNLIKKTIFKVQNKTNNKFKITNFNKYLNKTDNKFKISNFNKYLITLISLLFFYLFYLSLPTLYDKTWVQTHIENKLFKEFKLNFSISSDISYRILPTPHFLIKDSKIFKKDDNKSVSIADIKYLKIFVSQANFFKKENMLLKRIKINEANFSLFRNDFKLLNDSTINKFSNKKIEINKSNIFFKDNSEQIISIIKISKAFLFYDNDEMLNLFKLQGEVFNTHFSLEFRKNFDLLKNEEISIEAKKLKLNIINTSNGEKNNYIKGINIISFLNSKINTNYTIQDDVVTFESSASKLGNAQIDYNGEVSINPFTLNMNIDLGNYRIFKLLNSNSILSELIKTKLLFNENISINTTIVASSNSSKDFFQSTKINFDIINGNINFDKTEFINKKIGSVVLESSNLFFKNDNLTLSTDIVINIDNYSKLFSLLQTNKKFRKPIKNILVNLDYDFLTNQIEFNNLKIDNKETNEKLLRILQNFSDSKFNNWIINKRLLNELFENYAG